MPAEPSQIGCLFGAAKSRSKIAGAGRRSPQRSRAVKERILVLRTGDGAAAMLAELSQIGCLFGAAEPRSIVGAVRRSPLRLQAVKGRLLDAGNERQSRIIAR